MFSVEVVVDGLLPAKMTEFRMQNSEYSNT